MSEQPNYFAHETAIVEAGSRIGAGTKVWHHAHVRDDADIGADCVLGKNVFVDAGARVGDRVKIQNNVSVFHGVVIADEVFVGPSVVFTNDLLPRATNAEWVVEPTVIERGASLGANATIVCGNTVGSWAMVAAGSVVTSSVAPHALVMGNPARIRGWVCRCGEVVSRDHPRPERLVCGVCGADEPFPDEMHEE